MHISINNKPLIEHTIQGSVDLYIRFTVVTHSQEFPSQGYTNILRKPENHATRLL